MVFSAQPDLAAVAPGKTDGAAGAGSASGSWLGSDPQVAQLLADGATGSGSRL